MAESFFSFPHEVDSPVAEKSPAKRKSRLSTEEPNGSRRENSNSSTGQGLPVTHRVSDAMLSQRSSNGSTKSRGVIHQLESGHVAQSGERFGRDGALESRELGESELSGIDLELEVRAQLEGWEGAILLFFCDHLVY